MTITGRDIHGKEITFKFNGYQLSIIIKIVEENRHLIRSPREYGDIREWIWYISETDRRYPYGRRLRQKSIQSLYHHGIIKGVSGTGVPNTGRSYSFFPPEWVLTALKKEGIGLTHEPPHKEKLSLDTE